MSIQDLELHSPDTVAECFSGVSSELYVHIWNVVLPAYEADLPTGEDTAFYLSLEPNSTGWLKYVDAKFKDDLELVAKKREEEMATW